MFHLHFPRVFEFLEGPHNDAPQQEIRMLNLDAAGGSLPMCSCPFPGMNVAWIQSTWGSGPTVAATVGVCNKYDNNM